jgi:AGCS family alanine or glycine:cation symporter
MFLFGRSKAADFSYKILFCIFVVIGSSASLGAVVGFSDAMIFAMSVPNIIGLMLLLPKVREELKKYLQKVKAMS